jgi:WD40 repeat protein
VQVEQGILELIQPGRLAKLGQDDVFTIFTSDKQNYFIVSRLDKPDELHLSVQNIITLPGNIDVSFGAKTSPSADYLVIDYLDHPDELRFMNGETIPLSTEVADATFSASGYLFIDYEDGHGELRLSNGEKANLAGDINHNGLSFSPSGSDFIVDYAEGKNSELYLSSGAVIPLFDDLEHLNIITEDQYGVRVEYPVPAAFSPNGEFVLIDYLNQPDELRWLDGKIIPLVGEVHAVSFSSNEGVFLIEYADGQRKLYSSTGEELLDIAGTDTFLRFSEYGKYYRGNLSNVPSMLFPSIDKTISSNDESVTITSNQNGEVSIIDYGSLPDEMHFSSGKVVTLPGDIGWIPYRSPDGASFAISYDGTSPKIYSSTGDSFSLNNGEFYDYNWLTFSPNGKYFIIKYYNETTELWNLEQQRPITTLNFGVIDRHITRFEFGPNGRLFIWDVSGRAYILDLNWLDRIDTSLAGENLLRVACRPFVTNPDLFDETQLINYIGNKKPQACQE